MLRVHWQDVRKGTSADGRLLRPDSPVKLRSQHHHERPVGYEIYELVPKVFRKWRGYKFIKITHSDAYPRGQMSPVSVFESEEFRLPGPRGDQTGEVEYQGMLEDCDLDEQEAFKVRCGYLTIKELRRGKHTEQTLDPALESDIGTVSLGKLSREADWSVKYEARAAVDPKVKISLLQGDELLRHLTARSERYIDLGELGESSPEPSTPFVEALSGAAAVYFAGLPFPDSGSAVVRDLSPAWSLRIEVGAPPSEDLRAAFSVKVQDIENNYMTTTDPVFLTSVHGQIIATDLPTELLTRHSLNILVAMAEADGNVAYVAQREGRPVSEIWDRVVLATEELGAASVGEAVASAAFASGVIGRIPALV